MKTVKIRFCRGPGPYPRATLTVTEWPLPEWVATLIWEWLQGGRRVGKAEKVLTINILLPK